MFPSLLDVFLSLPLLLGILSPKQPERKNLSQKLHMLGAAKSNLLILKRSRDRRTGNHVLCKQNPPFPQPA